MFAVIIGEEKDIKIYREYLERAKIDVSNIISPKELSPLVEDIYNHYLLKRADAVIVITNNDQFNFYIAKLCRVWYKTPKVVSSINNSNNYDVFESIGIEDVIDVSLYTKQSLNKFLEKKE